MKRIGEGKYINILPATKFILASGHLAYRIPTVKKRRFVPDPAETAKVDTIKLRGNLSSLSHGDYHLTWNER